MSVVDSSSPPATTTSVPLKLKSCNMSPQSRTTVPHLISDRTAPQECLVRPAGRSGSRIPAPVETSTRYACSGCSSPPETKTTPGSTSAAQPKENP